MSFKSCFISVTLLLLLGGFDVHALTMEPPGIPSTDPYLNCYRKPQRGPCKAMFEKYSYSAKDGKCAPFFWGGCGGVVPFETLEACEKTCIPPETLNIKKLQALNDIYAEVSLEFPKAWEDPQFQVQVDGKDVNAKHHSGGYSGDRRMTSLLFFPGKPGTKQISVSATVGDKPIRVSQSFNWNGRPFAVLLDYPGDRLLLTDKKKIRIVTANVENVTIRINGERTTPEIIGREASLFSIDPAWRPGLNALSVEGRGVDGSSVNRSYTFIYPRDGVKQGETILLSFGVQGTKSGPFFSISIEGDAIVPGPDRTADSSTLDNEGWLGRETTLVRELRAVKPGQAKILIFEKPHFLQERRLIREISITVTPGG